MLVGSRTRIEKGRIETIPPFFVFCNRSILRFRNNLSIRKKIGVLRVLRIIRVIKYLLPLPYFVELVEPGIATQAHQEDDAAESEFDSHGNPNACQAIGASKQGRQGDTHNPD